MSNDSSGALLVSKVHDIALSCCESEAHNLNAVPLPVSPKDVFLSLQNIGHRLNLTSEDLVSSALPTQVLLGRALILFILKLPKSVRNSFYIDCWPEEPAFATEETSAHPLWLMGALIQDVWEHTCDEGAIARDKQLTTMLGEIKASNVYDFGAGAGYFAIQEARRRDSVHCVEANFVKKHFLRFCCKLIGIKNLYLTNFKRQKYDLIIAIDVLDHLKSPASVLSDLSRRIMPNGKLVLHANFPEDDWHQGGEDMIRNCYVSMTNHFVFDRSIALDQYAVSTVILRRRDSSLAFNWGVISPEKIITLNPFIEINDFSIKDEYVVTSKSFLVAPLMISRTGKELLEYFLTPRVFSEAYAFAKRYNMDVESFVDVLTEFRESRVIAIEDAI